MRISVVIATFNRAALLGETLEALERQPYATGDEVIVVDNGSTDETASIIESATRRFPVPLRYIAERTPGKTAALIAGVAAAHGDVLALTDDDVVVAQDWIPTIRRLFLDGRRALVGGRVDPRWERPAPRWLRVERGGLFTRMASPLGLLHYGDAQPLGTRTALGGNMAIRRDVLQAVGGFTPGLGRRRGTLLCGEDHDVCMRVSAAGYLCEYRPELRVSHWVPTARTRLSYYLRWFAWLGVMHAMFDFADTAAPKPALLGSPRYIWRRFLAAPGRSLSRLARGDATNAAAELMEAALAAGYIVQRIRQLNDKRQERRTLRQQAPQLPASVRPPAVPIPDPRAGKRY